MKLLHDPQDDLLRVAIFMSGSGSNAEKIIERYLSDREAGDIAFEPVLMVTDNPDSNAVHIATKRYGNFTLPVFTNSIRGFYRTRGIEDIANETIREEYDDVQAGLLREFGINCVALAGYDWKVTPILCNSFLTTNVHPGRLDVKDENGKPKYRGLAWVPSAKAILAGDNEVYTSVHLVTPELDNGAVIAVSEAQPVPLEARVDDRKKLLGEAESLKGISDFIRKHPSITKDELCALFPIYRLAADCQKRLKENGDWLVYPQAIRDVADGKYALDGKTVYFDRKPIPAAVR